MTDFAEQHERTFELPAGARLHGVDDFTKLARVLEISGAELSWTVSANHGISRTGTSLDAFAKTLSEFAASVHDVQITGLVADQEQPGELSGYVYVEIARRYSRFTVKGRNLDWVAGTRERLEQVVSSFETSGVTSLFPRLFPSPENTITTVPAPAALSMDSPSVQPARRWYEHQMFDIFRAIGPMGTIVSALIALGGLIAGAAKCLQG